MDTIILGDGGTFNYSNCRTNMTIDDYIWGLMKPRFNCQTRLAYHPHIVRCLYYVADHCVRHAQAMLDDGCSDEAAYYGLMHESDEVVFADIASPCKVHLSKETRQQIGNWGLSIDALFDVNPNFEHKRLVKHYDLRMLLTEKRDLMPQCEEETWRDFDQLQGLAPFDFKITPCGPDQAFAEFKRMYKSLRP
jgi:uncharacterized protein